MNDKMIRPPRFARKLLAWASRKGNRDLLAGDIEEEFYEMVGTDGEGAARRWFTRQVLRSLVPLIFSAFTWNISLIGNYMKISLRNLLKNKGYSLLNILGLSTGLACCLFIFLFVDFESSYDSYHPDSERIYRVARIRKTPSSLNLIAMSTNTVSPVLRERFPEVENAAVIDRVSCRYVTANGRRFMHDRIFQAEPEILGIFDIEFLAGDRKTALTRPNTALITKSLGEKYFAGRNPIGMTVAVDTTEYEITGVIADCPGNTHLKYDLLAHYKYIEQEWHDIWGGPVFNFVKLAEGTDPSEFEKKITYLPHEYAQEKLEARGMEYKLFLQPIESIHLDSDLRGELEPPGNRLYLMIFSIVGVFILLISCMNFMNLTTARSAGRALEVGIRKVSGAGRGQLVLQFLGESIIISAIAVVVALTLSLVSLQWFNRLFNFNFTDSDILNPRVLLFCGSMALLTGMAGGTYSSFVLSSFRPSTVLKGSIREGARGSFLRKSLVIGQFSISTALIASTLIFNSQLSYMKNQYPGWDRSQKLVIEFNRNSITGPDYSRIKSEFLDHTGVKGGTFSSSVPSRWMYGWHLFPYGEEETKGQIVNAFAADEDFFREMGIDFIVGRSYDGSEPIRGCVINRAAMEAYEWNDPAEALLHQINRPQDPIMGVVENFNFRGLQQPVGPLVVFNIREDYRYLTLNVDVESLEDVMAHIDKVHSSNFPDEMYEYFFLDEEFDKQYRVEDLRARMFVIFAFFGIFIACLGLLGLSAFLTQQRTKEVGVRKVFGASVADIAMLMSREFLKWVIISNIVAWPIAWIVMERFLRAFSTRIDIGITHFLAAGSLALAVAALTVSYQAVKAGLTDPVDSLKYE